MELAIAIPVLLLIFFGMVKYSNLMRLAMTMTQIAYESGRQGSIDPDLELGSFSNLSANSCPQNSNCDRQQDLQSYISKLSDAYGISHHPSALDVRTAQFAPAPASELPASTASGSTLAANSEQVVLVEVLADLRQNNMFLPVQLKTRLWVPYLFQTQEDNPPPGPATTPTPYVPNKNLFPVMNLVNEDTSKTVNGSITSLSVSGIGSIGDTGGDGPGTLIPKVPK